MDAATKEKLEKTLQEKKSQKAQVEIAFHQLIGQIALLEELLKEEKK